MCLKSTQYEKFCRDEFAELHKKLDRLDTAIRGNGRLGIITRIDRLERTEAVRNKLLWLIAGSSITAAMSLLAAVIVQIIKL